MPDHRPTTGLGGTGLGSPAVVPLKGDRAFVTARGGDGSIVYKEQQTDGTWPADWSTIAGEAAAGATRRRSSARPTAGSRSRSGAPTA